MTPLIPSFYVMGIDGRETEVLRTVRIFSMSRKDVALAKVNTFLHADN